MATRLRRVLLALLLIIVSPAILAVQPVVVVTSYPQELISRFEDAFTRSHPDLTLEVIWRMPRDAMPYLISDAGKGVDVYWAASGRNFSELAQRGSFQPLPEAGPELPAQLGGFTLSDPGRRYVATELATYGFVVNPAYLERHGLPLPKTWNDLRDPRYRGHILLPTPSRVGFAPLMVEVLLQRFGWEEGWALLSEIAANSELWAPGGAFITEEVANGRKGVAVTIDFFASSEIANGAPLEFVYPDVIGISPGHVAIMRDSPNPDAARRFVDFLLSVDGQRLLVHPDIRKLPVRPAVYATLPANQFNPFSAAARSRFDFAQAKALERFAVDNAVFDAMITLQGPRHARLWQLLHEAEASLRSGELADGEDVLHKARVLALLPPIDEAQSQSDEVRAALGNRAVRGGTETPPQVTPLQSEWVEAVAQRHDSAIAMLESLLASQRDRSAAAAVR